jgi:hypothetical protein
VDDILVIAICQSKYLKLLEQIKTGGFEVGSASLVKWYLGQRIFQEEEKIKNNQTAMIETILSKYNMAECNITKSPTTTNWLEEAKDEEELLENVSYRSLIGSLLYLATHTRPDIVFAVGELSKFNDKHTQKHWSAAKKSTQISQRNNEISTDV